MSYLPVQIYNIPILILFIAFDSYYWQIYKDLFLYYLFEVFLFSVNYR